MSDALLETKKAAGSSNLKLQESLKVREEGADEG